MTKIITFGSATWDIYIEPKQKKIIACKDFISQKALAFNLGSKIDLKNTSFNIGGGGVNTAFSFQKQGFKVSYMGVVGQDVLGEQIINKLKNKGIKTNLIQKTNQAQTNCSIIFNYQKKDRTIMVYRGASQYLEFKKIKADWFYLAPLSGKISYLTKEIIDYAHNNNIKIAFNPGNTQLKTKDIKSNIKKVDILILNKEEAAILTKTDYKNEKLIIEKIKKFHSGITVITKGKDGVIVISQGKTYFEKSQKVKVIDQTGAGDAFGSGFVSGIIKYNDISKAIKLGIENATKCIQFQGSNF